MKIISLLFSVVFLLTAAVVLVSAYSPTLQSRPVGFLGVPGSPYQYGPTISLVGSNYVAMYCSPGIAAGDWDVIRLATSGDFQTWSSPEVILAPQNGYDANSVCDPSLVLFNGQWLLYHTCINTANPPDGYTNNRICVSFADGVLGPYYSPPNPVVIQDLSCDKDPNKFYCVGQPSAVVAADGKSILLYYTNSNGVDARPPNPGNVYVQQSFDGFNFSPLNNGNWVYPQRDVDVKYDRVNRQYLMVQGDVGSTVLSYATSHDGVNWTSYNPAIRNISTNPDLPSGGSNNNPGLVGQPDGSFAGMTSVVYGSSPVPGWGKWLLYNSQAFFTNASCENCCQNSCDFACRNSEGTQRGQCSVSGSTNPAGCCECYSYAIPAGCGACVGAGVTGCVAACRAAGKTTGYCAKPGSTNPTDCCTCM